MPANFTVAEFFNGIGQKRTFCCPIQCPFCCPEFWRLAPSGRLGLNLFAQAPMFVVSIFS